MFYINMGNSLTSKYSTKLEAKTSEQIKEKLREYGVCYVPNVLTDSQRLAMISGTWDFFEHITQHDDIPIKRNNPSSWKLLSSLCPTNGMLYQNWNAGHSQHVWDIRQNPTIVNIFADFWECREEDLTVSFDGFGFLPPPEIIEENWYTPNSEMYHLDQSLHRPYFDGVQAFVTANDIEEGDATLSVYEKSHTYLSEFIEKFGFITPSNWVVFDDEQKKFFSDRCKRNDICCPAKSLIIWDSRVVHCGIKPRQGRKHENTRCISFVSYSKKERISSENKKLKNKALRQMITSNHYAHTPTFFSTLPAGHNTSDEYIVPIDPPILTDLGKSLACVTD